MEQKRTLWIIAAVGVFLLVVLGAALMLYAPAARPAQSVASRGNDKATASNGWISLAPSAPAQGRPYDFQNVTPPEGQPQDFDPSAPRPDAPGSEFRTDEVNIYAENANVYSENTDLNGLGKNASVTGNIQPPAVINNTTTIDLNSTPASAVVTQNGKTAASKSAEPVPPAAVASAKTAKTPAKQEKAVAKAAPAKETPVSVQKVAVKPTGVKQSVSVAAKAPAKPAAVSKASKTVSAKPAITQYWIQVTALTSRKSADAAREVLGENQITADVFTYTDAKNQLFYRVRVGPYTTKSEAEYWRTKIAKIDNFAGTASYVTAAQVE